jgi:MFS family permease
MVTFGNAMVSDIATSSQRGSYIGWASLEVLLGPAISPIIGGVLNQNVKVLGSLAEGSRGKGQKVWGCEVLWY